MPPDTVDWAELTIDAWLVDGNNDDVYVGETFELGALTSGAWYTFGFSRTTFDIAAVFSAWEAGSILEITIKADEYGRCNFLKIIDSTLEVCYIDNHIQPVPEPATLLLLGAGLIGIGRLSRNRS